MTDARLRQLERRWKESGAERDHARFLVERLRTGELVLDRARLAAHLGDPAAREALGLVDEPSEPGGQRAWALDLCRWRGAVPGRAALAAARRVLPVFDRGLNPDPRPRRALRAAEAFVVCPCDAHLRRAASAGDLAEAAAHDDAGTAVWEAVRAVLGGAPEQARAGLARVEPPSPDDSASRDAGSQRTDHPDVAASEVAGALEAAVVAAGRVAGVVAVRTAIRDELVPWALGYGDPLARRLGRA